MERTEHIKNLLNDVCPLYNKDFLNLIKIHQKVEELLNEVEPNYLKRLQK